jgi:hypothetical protein
LTSPVTSIHHIPILGVVCILCCSSNKACLCNCKCDPANLPRKSIWLSY